MAGDIKDDHPSALPCPPAPWDADFPHPPVRRPVRKTSVETRVYSASTAELCAVLGIPLAAGPVSVIAVELVPGGHVEVTVREETRSPRKED